MKFILVGLFILGSASTYAQTAGRDLISEGARTNVSPTELKKCNEIANKYSLSIEKLEKIRSANALAITEQEKVDFNEVIDEISSKRQMSLNNGAMNMKCSFTLPTKVEELLALKIEHLVTVTKNSPSLQWAKEEVDNNCKALNGAIVGNSSCEKKRDGYSYPNQHGGQINVLPDFECSQVCRVNTKN